MIDDTTRDWLAEAEQLDALREDHEEQCRLASMFRGASAAAVVRMWANGEHWSTGKQLSERETEALVERWCALFNRLPPGELASEPAADHGPAVPLDQHPVLAVPDDAMLRPRDVLRLFGYARSTLKRHVAAGSFPSPQRAAPGQRFIGWPARQLKAWLVSQGLGEDTRH